MTKLTIDEIANFCKRKGLVFRSSDIYGGLAGFWDFGPTGVELFNNIKTHWWNHFVRQKDNMVGMDASIINHPKAWVASGHVTSFKDVFVKCKKCKKTSKIEPKELDKAKCECGGQYENLGEFDMLFKTEVGAQDKQTAYLRGETAQAMFMDMKQIAESSRLSLPFGIAQIGRCFRNEISPRNFLFRSREFNIGELEFFIHPEEEKCNLLDDEHLNIKLKLLDSETQKSKKETLKETTIKHMLKEKMLSEWHAYWLAEQIIWFNNIGIKKIKVREHMDDERSFYSSATFDIDYEYPFGSQEIAGNANRGQYDLTQQSKESGKDLEIYDEKTKKKVLPKVIEPTFGIERIFLAAIVEAFEQDKDNYIRLKLSPQIAPIKAAVLPLVKNDEKLVILSKKIFHDLKQDWNIEYDESGSIGRRYARNDEIGTPFCITIDNETIKDHSVTIRNRDDGAQKRVKINELNEIINKLIKGKLYFKDIED